MSHDFFPPDAKEALPGILGALFAIPFTQGPRLMRAAMFGGGASLSYFGAVPFSQAMGMTNGAGLAGFVLGLFGMSVAAKVYEALAVFAAGDLSRAVLDWARRKLGV